MAKHDQQTYSTSSSILQIIQFAKNIFMWSEGPSMNDVTYFLKIFYPSFLSPILLNRHMEWSNMTFWQIPLSP